MQRVSALTLVCCVLLAACGAPEQPIAPEPPVAQQAPTDVSDQSQNVDSPPAADQLAPKATPQPRGKRLREVWPITANKQSPITTLLYSSVAPTDDDQPPLTNIFWRADLNDMNNRQKLVEIALESSLNPSIFGQVSPDRTHIAYVDPTSDYVGDLYILGIDGANKQLVATGVAHTGGACHRSFVWSLDGQQLAFVQSTTRDKTYDDAIHIYDLSSTTIVNSVKVGWAFLVGWQEPQGLLAITSSGQGQPRVIDAIGSASVKHQAVATLPAQGFFCSNISPDHQKILLDLDTGSYLFNAKAKNFRKVTIAAQVSAWNPDSARVVEIAGLKRNTAQILDVTTTQLSAQSVVLADDAPTTDQQLLSASPDGHYLVTCEERQIETRGYLFRTMLYDIANDHWEPLAEGQRCITVLGWQ